MTCTSRRYGELIGGSRGLLMNCERVKDVAVITGAGRALEKG
jgi:hypothetical protein